MFAKLISETRIDTASVPRFATIDGIYVCGDLPEAYLNSLGYYVLQTTDPSEAPDGYHMEPRYAYDSDETPTKIVQTWVEVEDPPAPIKVYSKLKILLAADQAGIADPLMDFIESDRKLKYIWDASNTIEDNELLQAYIPTIASALSKTEQEVYAFLDNYCIAD